MWWRTPWLEQRRPLFGLALFDAVAIISTYNFLFKREHGHLAGITGSVIGLLTMWLTLSYLLGRYSKSESEKRIWTVACVTTVVMVITIMTVWLGGVRDPRANPVFVLPLLSCSGALSVTAEHLVNKQVRAPKRWLLLVSEHEAAIVKREMSQAGTNNTQLIEVCHDTEQALKSLAAKPKGKGIAIGQGLTISDEAVLALLQQRSAGLQVLELLDWCELELQRVPAELLSAHWLLLADGFRLRPGQAGWRLKRLGDVVMSILLITLSSPIVIIAGLLIKLEDGGPILYRQVRTGLYGEHFDIWKLRSMHVGAENSGARWATKSDSRITRVGYWLRRLRIDELPQLKNVILGEMSLIGPRPERPEFDIELEKIIPHYTLRNTIRPGLSGWAQVCFSYGSSLEDSKTKLGFDLYYLRNFSPFLDILILLKTLKLISRGSGAIPSESTGSLAQEAYYTGEQHGRK